MDAYKFYATKYALLIFWRAIVSLRWYFLASTNEMKDASGQD
jgi:hypothetical protein